MTTTNNGKNDNGARRPSNGHRVPGRLIEIQPGLYTVVHSNSIFVEPDADAELPTTLATIKPGVGLLEPA